MSKLNALMLAGAFAAVAIAAIPQAASAQNRPGATVTTSGNPVRVNPERPTVTQVRPIRPDRRGDQLQERLRNACFGSPNPPSQVCRRYFGDHAGGPRD